MRARRLWVTAAIIILVVTGCSQSSSQIEEYNFDRIAKHINKKIKMGLTADSLAEEIIQSLYPSDRVYRDNDYQVVFEEAPQYIKDIYITKKQNSENYKYIPGFLQHMASNENKDIHIYSHNLLSFQHHVSGESDNRIIEYNQYSTIVYHPGGGMSTILDISDYGDDDTGKMIFDTYACRACDLDKLPSGLKINDLTSWLRSETNELVHSRFSYAISSSSDFGPGVSTHYLATQILDKLNLDKIK